MRSVIAFVALLACSRATPIVPAESAATSQAATPSAPIVGTFSLRVAVSSEVSCSQSFEHDSERTAYVLSLAADGSASLSVERRTSHIFGPSASKYGSGPVSHTETSKQRAFAGRASTSGSATRVELRESCDAGACATAVLTCARADIEIVDRKADAGRARIAGIRCTSLPMMPEEATKHLTSAAPLADGTGLMFISTETPYPETTLTRMP